MLGASGLTNQEAVGKLGLNPFLASVGWLPSASGTQHSNPILANASSASNVNQGIDSQATNPHKAKPQSNSNASNIANSSYGGEIGSHQYGRQNGEAKKNFPQHSTQQQQHHPEMISNSNFNPNQRNPNNQNNKGKNFRPKPVNEMNAMSSSFANSNINSSNTNTNNAKNFSKNNTDKSKKKGQNAQGNVYRVVNK